MLGKDRVGWRDGGESKSKIWRLGRREKERRRETERIAEGEGSMKR